MYVVLAGLALLGHVALCIAAINRLHSFGMPRAVLRVMDIGWGLFLFGLPAGLTYQRMMQPETSSLPVLASPWAWLVGAYAALSIVAAVVTLVRIAQGRRCAPTTTRLTGNHTQRVNMLERLGQRPVRGLVTRLASYLPGNEILQLEVHDRSLSLARLPAELDGLTIAHLSDLHFTGGLTAEFFHEVVRRTNDFDPDLVAITGDIIDTPRCLPWIPEILGNLVGRHGVFFVLGNHERRLPREAVLRRTLVEVGLIDLGRRWRAVQVGATQVILAGNELPWYGPAADLASCPTSARSGERPLRIVLSHSPDQLPWARKHDVDLMLAGHCHGGQCRLPLIGPILSPSRFGVWYASGTFYEAPTLLHVSRGLSGTRPLRLNCPPELTRLVLRRELAHSDVKD